MRPVGQGKAAGAENQLQRSIYASVLHVGVIDHGSEPFRRPQCASHFTDHPVTLGLQHTDLILFLLTQALCMVTFSSRRLDVCFGIVHLDRCGDCCQRLAFIDTRKTRVDTAQLASGPQASAHSAKVSDQTARLCERMVRCFSICQSRCFSVLRLSCSCLPRARPISTLTLLPFQYIAVGTRV